MKKNTIRALIALIAISLSVSFAMAQSTSLGNSRVPGYILGWNSGTAGSLEIQNEFTGPGFPINFSTSAVPQATLDINGNFSIGQTSNTNYFGIGADAVLWHNGNPLNIFVGVSAGNGAICSSCMTYETCVGYMAGNHIASSDVENTFIGSNAGSNAFGTGFSTYGCSWNTAVGVDALKTTHAYGGCALGISAGSNDTYGCSLTAMGESALYSNTIGNDNCAYGHDAMYYNRSLSDNVAIGSDALISQTFNPTACGPNAKSCVSSYNVAVGNMALYNNDPNSITGNVLDNGFANTAIGHQCLYSNTQGTWNTGGGYQAGYYNQAGNYNTNFGYQAGYGVSGNDYSENDNFGWGAGYASASNLWNVCLGMEAGYSNVASYNTYVGHGAAEFNASGDFNTVMGFCADQNDVSGSQNTFMGTATGASNNADDNSGFGTGALAYNISGSDNTALGNSAGQSVLSGGENVFVGSYADVGTDPLNNTAAYGYGATATASNEFMFGNTSVTGLYTTVAMFAYSDGRFKTNVQNENIGLDFINKLRPVTYNMDTKALDAYINANKPQRTDSAGNPIKRAQLDFSASTNIVHSGFIAQEVDSVSKALGYTSSIVSEPKNSNDPYALNYSEFVVPLVKAVQQLDSINKGLAAHQQTQDSISAGLAARMQAQDSIINALQNQINSCCTSNQRRSSQSDTSTTNVSLSNTGGIILNGNDPNPFSEYTVITFNIPSNVNQAKIIFYDNLGRIINTVVINERGPGQLDVYASNLSAGIYSYSLLADGQVIDTKKMVCEK